MQETWYVLEDGSSADPREVAPDDKGVLRHKSGQAVAIGDHGNPRSRGVDVEEEAKKARKSKAKSDIVEKESVSPRDRQVKAEDDGVTRYKTR